MLKILEINIIYLIFYLRLVEPYSTTTISDYLKDSSVISANNHNIDYPSYEYFTFNGDQYNAVNQFNNELSTQTHLEESIVPSNDIEYTTPYAANGFVWGTDGKFAQNSLLKFKREYMEGKCLLDSLKLSVIWWSNTNGTLWKTNLGILKYQRQLDLSYHNISSDEEVLSRILNTAENMTIVAFSLAYNNLTRAPFQTLETVANNLKYLSLKGNPFTYEKPMNPEYNSSPGYYRANLSSSNRGRLFWATFPHMPSLLELDISDCHIEYIGKSAFQNLTNLRSLYMSHNKMLRIPSDTFLYTPYLQVLDLSSVSVNDLLNEIIHFKASPNLELVMKFIYGIDIEPNMFKRLPNLKYLDLSHTKLSSSSALAFKHVGANLKYLSLCYTSFPAFGYRYLQNSPLIGLDLSGNANAAYNLHENVFKGLSHSLTYLFIEKANLIDISFLKPLHNLRFLGLHGNYINTLLAEHFMELKQLQILDLSSNRISNWHSPVFKLNENLRILGLQGNIINVITTEMVHDFSMVEYLSIGNNNFVCDCMLRDIVETAAANHQEAHCKGSFWRDLQDSIDIKSIHLSQILRNLNLFANISLNRLDVPSLVVSQNLYKLKQSAPELIKVQNFKNNWKTRFVLNALRSYKSSRGCMHRNTSPKSLNGTLLKLQLFDYKDEHYWCYNQTKKERVIRLNCQRALIDIEEDLNGLSTSVLATVGCLIAIITLGILIYKKRWHIYYYYNSLKSAALLSVVAKDKQNRFNSLCYQNPNMIYDIFVSYCQSDRDWIVKEFMPNVEASSDISICLHERDFVVGVTILDNIVSCMERSKALMLIISSNFLISHWCQFELQLAQHQIFDLDKDNLILVLLEDIPRSKRPKNLQFLMTIKTYIRWPGSKCQTNIHDEDCKLFWKRLKRTLSNISLNASQSIA